MTPLPWLVEAAVAALLLASGVLSIVGAIGLVRLKSYFTRMHAPALASTGGVWCVTAATIVYFSAVEGAILPYAIVVSILLAITAPVTTLLLARTGLFRNRLAGKDVPAAFGGNPGSSLPKRD
ncbi:MAG TPA: Na+/H+ antiporter subunit G [Usitatibacter sp.]|nr:Na+/H+ antiporter subunit G [Usitatibacter sp.]